MSEVAGKSRERIARARAKLRRGWGDSLRFDARSDGVSASDGSSAGRNDGSSTSVPVAPQDLQAAPLSSAGLLSRRRLVQGSLLAAAAGIVASLPRGRENGLSDPRIPHPEPFETARRYPLDPATSVTLDQNDGEVLALGDHKASPLGAHGHRKLALYNENTGETVTATFWSEGDYVREELESIHWLLRDHHVDETLAIDLNLVEQLYTLRTKLETDEPLHILSAYRTPTTNAKLRGIYDGVAVNSFHIKGQAVDLRIPGRRKRDLLKAARALKAGGVGNYRTYIHIDSGPVRFW